MHTLLAYALEREAPEHRVQAGLERVAGWYEPLWGTPVQRDAVEVGRLGLVLWSPAEDARRWPAWSVEGERAVASLHVPLGHARLPATPAGGWSPAALIRHLDQHPDDALRLTAPFVLAELDRAAGTLTLRNDGLGLGRLFEVRTAEGRFWSNRPVAAIRIAGVRAEADPLAWRRMAACGWAMGDVSPYRGVRVLPAASRVRAGAWGSEETSGDTLAWLVRAGDADPLGSVALDRTAEALTDAARSAAAAWPDIPVLSLSGGRDSRLVAAAHVAAGLDVRLRTYATSPGEVETARRLVGLLPGPVAHEVNKPRAQQPGGHREGALTRARRWHDAAEALRPAVYLNSAAPRRLPQDRPPLIAGVGGEFGHEPGYPADVERLERLPTHRRIDAFARALQAKVVLPRGVGPEALTATDQQVRGVLAHAADLGVEDARMLDWFYADERLRRWGMAGESTGRLMPLLSPDFVRSGFALSTAQSRASALHHALLTRLVPAWAEVPFFSASLHERHGVARQRLWQDPDAEAIAGIVADPDGWADAFDVPVVQAVWRHASEGRAGARDEQLLQRVVWRAAFDEHLAAVNGDPPPHRPAAPLRTTASGSPTADRGTRRRNLRSGVLGLAQQVAVHANDVPLARRLARTRVGRYLRKLVGV